MRRPLQHRSPLRHQRVAGADGRANLRHQQSTLAGHLQDFPEWALKIFLDVVAEGLERRNVDDLGFFGE